MLSSRAWWTRVAILTVLGVGLATAADQPRWVGVLAGKARPAAARWRGAGAEEAEVTATTAGFHVRDVRRKGKLYAALSAPSAGVTERIGAPALPVIRRLAVVPDGAEVTVLGEGQARTLKLADVGVKERILPRQRPIPKVRGAWEAAALDIDQALYATDAFWPQTRARVVEAGRVSGRRLVSIELYPVAYNPVKGEVRVWPQLRARVRFQGGRSAAGQLRPREQARLAAAAINAEAAQAKFGPGRLLIIAHDSFLTDMAPLVTHKTARGWTVDLVGTSTAGSTNTAIRTYIVGRYNNPPTRPDALLLVGDTSHIPHFVGGGAGTPPTDLNYACMDTGDDWQPELPVGRFSVASTTELQGVVAKTIGYETSPGGAWGTRAAFMTGEDNYSITEGTHNTVISGHLDGAGYTSQRLFGHTHGATTADVIAAFNAGCALGIYSGHGSTTSWADGPPVSQTQVRAFTNAGMLPFVCSFACVTGDYSYSECFAETWLRAPNKAAVDIWASSVNSYWTEDDILEKRLFDVIFTEGVRAFGPATLRAKQLFLAHFGATSTTRRYFEMYNLFGDPTVMLINSGLVVTPPRPMPLAFVGGPYHAQFTATSGTPPYTWSITAGTLPTGLGLNPTSGVITGTVNAPTVATVTVTVTDSVPDTDSATVTIHAVNRLQIVSGPTLPAAVVGGAYSTTLHCTGGTPTFTWHLQQGAYVEGPASGGWMGGGTPQGWRDDDAVWSLSLPWDFPFYGQRYNSVNVCSNGFLDFAAADTDYSNSSAELQGNVRIAPLWDDLKTNGTGQDIYVTHTASYVGVRWEGEGFGGGGRVAFEVLLFRSGEIEFHYGCPMSGLTPTIGISSGDGTHYTMASLDGASSISSGTTLGFDQEALLPPGLVFDGAAGVITGTPAATGTYSFSVRVTDSGPATQNDERAMSLTVTYGSALLVMGITPDSGERGEVVTITQVAGANFQSGATVELARGATRLAGTNVQFLSPTSLACNLDLSGLTPLGIGLWDVVVTNPSTEAATLTHGFEVLPILYNLSVTKGGPGTGRVRINHGIHPLPHTEPLPEGRPVTLTALPDPGSSFTRWGGSISGTVSPAVFVMDGHKAVTATFFAEAGSISGVKWRDDDGNGERDPGEPLLPGWVMYVDLNRDRNRDPGEPHAVTGPTGAYTITNVLAGRYYVLEEEKPGWVQTFPRGGVTSLTRAAKLRRAKALVEAMTTTGSTAIARITGEVGPGPVDGKTAQSGPLIRMNQFRADPRFAGINGHGYAAVILDSGIDVDHPFFGLDGDHNGVADRIVFQHDYVNGDGDASDDNGHGSNVSSIVGSSDSTHTGMAPVVDLIAMKVLSSSGSGNFGWVEQALQWVATNAGTYHIVSVNMSLGDSGNYSTAQSRYGLGDEMAALDALGVIVVSSAGNSFYTHSSATGVGYPSADPNSLAISAVYDANIGSVSYSSGARAYSSGPDRITPFSQRHPTLTSIFAPGAAITGANSGGSTVVYHGTSQAAPHIAGIVALAQQLADSVLGRRLTTAEFVSLMRSTGVTITDGDDEDDNVTNTSLTFQRVDMVALGEAILGMGGPGVHSVTVHPGQDTPNVNFGNRLPEQRLTVAKAGSGDGYAVINGTPRKLPFAADVAGGTAITLTGTGLTGSGFVGWSGSVTTVSPTISFHMDGPKALTATFGASVKFLVGTSVKGTVVHVDSVVRTPPYITSWTEGSEHGIGVGSPQTPPGRRHVFTSWSDGGAQWHTVVAPGISYKYIANFTIEFQITTEVAPPGAGTVTLTPDRPGGWYDMGQKVRFTATPGTDYSFHYWDFVGIKPTTTNPVVVSVGKSAIHAIAHFQSSLALAKSPVAIAPVGEVPIGPVVFRWQGVGDADTYDLWVSAGRGSPELLLRGVSITHTEPFAGLLAGEYQWWVMARSKEGRSAWSVPAAFGLAEVIAKQMPAPEPVSPKGRIKAGPATFRWTAVPGATAYELWVGEGSVPACRVRSTGAAVALPKPLAPGKYKWAVRALAGGTPGPWSASAQLDVE